MPVLKKTSQALNHWVRGMVSAMGMAMAGIVAVQVFCRYSLNHSLFWSEELARILLVWITFFGATVAYYHQAHPGVDALFRRLPPGGQKILALMSHLAALALFSVMVWYGTGFAWFVRLQITPALGWPKWVIMGAVPLSGLVFLVHSLALAAAELSGKGNRA